MSALRDFTSACLRWVPPDLLRAVAGVELLIPYYHMVSDEEVPHVRHLYAHKTIGEFGRDLEYLTRHYTPIGLADLLGALRGQGSLPRRAFLLTFDDGFREMRDVVAPMLCGYGINAVFFVNTAFTDNRELCYLNKASLVIDRIQANRSETVAGAAAAVLGVAQADGASLTTAVRRVRYQERGVIDELAKVVGLDEAAYLRTQRPYLTSADIEWLMGKGFGIGAHSVDHPLYADLSLAEQLRQTEDSLRETRERFGLPYGAFAFPHTDRGVSADFFASAIATGLLDVSFGTAGMLSDSVPNHFQRFSLETPRQSAERIVAFQMARRLAKAAQGRGMVVRH